MTSSSITACNTATTTAAPLKFPFSAACASFGFRLATVALVGLVGLVGCGGSKAPPAAQAGFTTPAPVPAANVPLASAPVIPTSAPLSQPNPLALPCQTDAQCLTHRCNVAAGKCAWPCQADTDCNPGNRCLPPMCIPQVQ